jgi:hypothetical protein
LQNKNNFLLSFRIVKRFFRRKKYENILNLISLIRFQWDYEKIRKGKKQSLFSAHKKMVEKYKNKLIILNSKEEVNNFLKNLK